MGSHRIFTHLVLLAKIDLYINVFGSHWG
jgi:hypothetical protein